MAAAPAAGTAFGTSALAASAPAYVGVAAASAPLASVGASMMMNPAIISPGGGGLLASATSLYNTVQPYMSLVSAGTSVLQAVNAYQRGQFMESQYKIQSLQTQAQQEINRLNLIKEANDKARRLLAINASTVATGFARGVNAFDGSVKLIAQKNEEAYLRDISTLEFNQQSSQYFQDAQMSMLSAAGDEAVRGSKFDAMYYIGNAVKLYDDTRVPT